MTTPVTGVRWVALASLLAFCLLAALVVGDAGAVVDADVAVHDRLRAWMVGHPTWLAWTAGVTHLGDTATVAALYAVVVVVCLVRRRRAEAIFAAASGVLGWAASRLIRALLGRVRPADRLWTADGPGFPSGHTTNAATFSVVLVILCWPLLARLGRIALVAGAIAYAALIGLTRVAGGVHWPSDVVGGWLFALACVTGIASVALTTHSERSIGAHPRSGDV